MRAPPPFLETLTLSSPVSFRPSLPSSVPSRRPNRYDKEQQCFAPPPPPPPPSSSSSSSSPPPSSSPSSPRRQRRGCSWERVGSDTFLNFWIYFIWIMLETGAGRGRARTGPRRRPWDTSRRYSKNISCIIYHRKFNGFSLFLRYDYFKELRDNERNAPGEF